MNLTASVDVIAGTSGSLEHSPNGTADAQIAALRQEYDQLRQRTDLTEATDTVWRLARDVGGFEARVEALRQGGYRFTQSLANGARLRAGDRRDMDGVLYLTDRRVLFEEKERTGAYLDGRHAGLDCSVIDQECLRSRDRELQRERAAVQLRSGICST